MRTRVLLLLLNTALLSCIVNYSFGQVYVKGRIIDQQQNLPSVTVMLLRADSSLAKEVITDTAGGFVFDNVAPGYYLVTTTVVGYAKFFSSPIRVNDEDVILPDIILERESKRMDEVVVRAKKPMYEQQSDRLVVNVQSSISSAGNTVLEVLQKSPGVIINRQDNTINMNGKSGVRIMINGKIIQLPLDVVVQMLDGMSSTNVERIELITAPPAKYDAEGSAGIIHIVMKGNPDFGTNGSYGFTLGYRWAETIGGNFNLNHRSNKISFSLDYSILRNHNLHTSKLNRQLPVNGFVQTINDYSRRENITTQQNLNAGLEWKLTDKMLLSLSVTGYRRNWDLDAVNTDSNHAGADSTLITTMDIHESNIWQSATAGIGLQSKIDSKNEISFTFDYLYYHNDNPSDYNNKIFNEQHSTSEDAKIDLTKKTPIRFLTAKADYQHTFSSSFIAEAGIKAVASNLHNDVVVRRWENNSWKTDPAFTSYSALEEQVAAGYISAKWNAGKNWQLNSGLRYEYTHTSISTPVEKNLVNRKYGYLFPDFLVKKDFDNGKDIQFSYSRRITRPTYNDIAPFVFFWGPGTFSSGNTSLFPAISDAVKAGYHFKQWIISVQFTHSKNEISFLQPEIDSLSNLIYRSQNMKYLNTLGITNIWSHTITPWWELQTNLTGQYLTSQTLHLPNNSRFSRYGLNVNLVNSIKLPGSFSIEISFMYQSRLLTGISEYLPVTLLNAGVQKKFGEKGTLRLAMDDILYNNYWKIRTYMPQNKLNSYFSYDFHNQFIRLTYTRKFGNNKLRSVKIKTGAEEEKGRVVN